MDNNQKPSASPLSINLEALSEEGPIPMGEIGIKDGAELIKDPTPSGLPAVETGVAADLAGHVAKQTIPYEHLPSKGKPYSTGSSVTFDNYRFKEIKLLNNSQLPILKVWQYSLRSIHTDFPIEELTLADALYINMIRKLAIKTSSEGYYKFVCPHCGHEQWATIRLSNLDFHEVEVDLPIGITMESGGDVELQFSPLRIGVYLSIIKNQPDLLLDDDYMMAAQVINMDIDEAYKLIQGATAVDVDNLMLVEESLHHGVKPYPFTCRKCKEESARDIDDLEALIRPFRETGQAGGSRVRFGKA